MAIHFPFACRTAAGTAVRVLSGALGEQNGVELDGSRLRVRLGFAFRAELLRDAITATPYDGRVLSLGVHGFGGDWLVNTSTTDLVDLTFAPPQRARVLGVPVKLRRLRLSLADPEGFLASLVSGS